MFEYQVSLRRIRVIAATVLALLVSLAMAATARAEVQGMTFMANSGIWTSSDGIGGGSQVVAGPGVSHATLSPDGERLVYTTAWSETSKGTAIRVMNASGGPSTVIWESGSLPNGDYDGAVNHPRFSPDGQWITYTYWPGPWDSDPDAEIWRMRPDGTERQRLFDWPGDQQWADYSPDLSRLVFLSTHTPGGTELGTKGSQGANPGDMIGELFVADADGTNPRRLSPDVESDKWLAAIGAPTFSPDGQSIAFHGWPGMSYAQVYVVDAYVGAPNLVSWATSGNVCRNGAHEGGMHPSWSPDGQYLAWEDASPCRGIVQARTNGSSASVIYYSESGPRRSRPRYRPAPDDAALLERYTPQLRYHSAESYRADSADTMVLTGIAPEGQDESWANNLERADGTVLASSDPFLAYPALTLAALPGGGSAEYPWGGSTLDSDRINARNGTYQQDAALMHQNPALANRIYARVTQGADGKTWLQYWFFYYYNEVFTWGDHEGDWEMIQIGLRSDLLPDIATYAQHAGAESCPWDRVPKYDGPSGTGPVVFVDLGSHGSLFHPQAGTYPPESSERVRPAIERQIDNFDPAWANWPGRWGGSTGEVDSPKSPGRQGMKWDDPTGFDNAADDCPSQASGAVTARAGRRVKPLRAPRRGLPAPQLAAHRSAKRVLVRYRYSRRAWKRLPRRPGIVLSVRGSKRNSLPRNVIFRLRHRVGQRRLGLPLSPGPYAVQGQTLSRSGGQSRPTTIHLR